MAYNPASITYTSGGQIAIVALRTDESDEMLRDFGEDPHEFNRYISPAGISQWGTMKGLVYGADKTIQSAFTSGSGGTLSLSDGANQITFPGICVAEFFPIDTAKTLWVAVFVDQRALIQYASISCQYNWPLPNQGASSSIQYIKSTTNSGTAYTLQNIIDKFVSNINSNSQPNISYTPNPNNTAVTAALSDIPEAINLQYASTAKALDAILLTYSMAMFYDPKQGTFTLDVLGNDSTSSAFGSSSNPNQMAWLGSNYPTGALYNPKTINVSYPQIPAPALGTDTFFKDLGANGTGIISNFTLMGTSFASTGAHASQSSVLGNNALTKLSSVCHMRMNGYFAVPMSGICEVVEWINRPHSFVTVVRYARMHFVQRPKWAMMDSSTATSYQGVTNRVDPFGQSQHFVHNVNFPAQITGSTLISANLWSYTFAQAQPTATAGGWQLVPSGITGTAFNGIEAGNAATGTLSTGWNPANFCSTNITLQPIRTGAVVMMAPVLNCATPPANVYVFQAANVIDGAC